MQEDLRGDGVADEGEGSGGGGYQAYVSPGKRRVPFDKSEGGVKDKVLPSVFRAPCFRERGLRTKTLEISR